MNGWRVLGVDACKPGWIGIALSEESASVYTAAEIGDLVNEAAQGAPLEVVYFPRPTRPGRAAGVHAAPTGFSVLRFVERDLPGMVYVENLASALYLDRQADVDRYLLAMEWLSLVAFRSAGVVGHLRQARTRTSRGISEGFWCSKSAPLSPHN